MAERMIQANGVELCAESFGDPAESHPHHGARRVDALAGGGLLSVIEYLLTIGAVK